MTPKKPSPPALPLTERERQILFKLQVYDGVLSLNHIQRIFGLRKTQTYQQMGHLEQLGLIRKSTYKQSKRLDQPVCWLSPAGAEWVAFHQGVMLADLSWREEPRWLFLKHDLSVVDFRLDVIEACEQSKGRLVLEEWVSERVFKTEADRITYQTISGEQRKKTIIPDSYFIVRVVGQEKDQFKRFFLEIDNATEDNPRFSDDKVLPGMAYLNSSEYERRFGVKGKGLFLVVTTGGTRLQNMLRHTKRLNVKRFLFTTFDKVTPETLFSHPIWHYIGSPEPVPLIEME
jgi:hypothetical protein